MCTTLRRTALAAPFRSLNRCFATVLAVALVTVTPFASAQQAATGTIRGRVQNATNGAYLENVTVQVNGTNTIVKTNGYGEYVIRNAPSGEVTLRANYVGEPEQTVTVSVPAGSEATHDFTFRETATTKRLDDGAIRLDPFVVSTERYKNARAIAIAEERNSINIKNVVAIDQFGDVPSGNVGEFVKFLPGIQVDYGASNGNQNGYSESTANGVSVRGFGPEDTTILMDGLPIAATVPGNLTRQTGLDQLNVNNASRVELIKVPTPDMPANSAGGQINLITRSAFEYSKPAYDASLFFNFNSQNLTLAKTQGPTNKNTFKTSPGVTFSASYPFSKTFGITVSGTLQEEFTQSYRGQLVWNNTWASNFNPSAFTNLAGQPSSLTNPVLTRYQITDTPSITDRTSGNIKVDWKPTPNQTLRFNVQYSTYTTNEAARRLDFRPTIAAGADWNPYQTIGTTANSTTAMTVGTRDRIGDTVSGAVIYDGNWKGWKVSAAANYSSSKSDLVDDKNGHYSTIDMNLNPGRVNLYLGADGIPYNAETFTRTTNLPLDYTQITNWSIANAQAFSGQSHNENIKSLYKVDVSRPLDFIPIIRNNPMTLSFGIRRDEETNKKDGRGTGYRQSLKPGATLTTADIVDNDYVGSSPGFGLRPQQWVSTYKIYELDKAKGLFDTATDGTDAVQNWISYVNQNKDLKETTDGAYMMLNGSFLNDRLSFLVGGRIERKARVGRTPFTDTKWNFVRNKDGSIYTDAAHPVGIRNDQAASDLFAATPLGTALRSSLSAAGITYPTTPYGSPTTSIEAVKLNRIALKEVSTHVTGKPSFTYSTAYKLTKKIDLKASFSRTFKQQPLENGTIGVISGNNLAINEFTLTEQANNNGALGQITVANPNLQPETSNNWDFEIAYYTEKGGKLSASYYNKHVKNATQSYTTYSGTPEFNSALTALGLDPNEYDGWRIGTSTNSSIDQTTDGYEFFASQDLGFLGTYGRRFSVFASWAMTNFPPPAPPVPYSIVNPDGTTTSLTPALTLIQLRADRFGGAGVQFSGNRFQLQVRGTYRNDAQDTTVAPVVYADGTIIRTMQPAETRIDVNMSYVFNKTFSVFASGKDVLNGERDRVWVDTTRKIPAWASLNDRKKFGATWTVGLKGHW